MTMSQDRRHTSGVMSDVSSCDYPETSGDGDYETTPASSFNSSNHSATSTSGSDLSRCSATSRRKKDQNEGSWKIHAGDVLSSLSLFRVCRTELH